MSPRRTTTTTTPIGKKRHLDDVYEDEDEADRKVERDPHSDMIKARLERFDKKNQGNQQNVKHRYGGRRRTRTRRTKSRHGGHRRSRTYSRRRQV